MSRTPRAVILHGYSSANKGDGLLVDRAIEIARETLGHDVEITLTANHPRTFDHLGITVVDSGPRRHGFSRQYLRLLRSLDEYDLVLGVGGGYMRFGTFEAAQKASVIHLPQLLAASRTSSPVVYLPQSIGPLRGPFRPLVRRLLRDIDRVWLRDDRSMAELAVPSARRSVDLALHDIDARRGINQNRLEPSHRPILSVRFVDGGLPDPLKSLAALMRPFDGYVQSLAGANDDRAANLLVKPTEMVTQQSLVDDPREKRVVIAVRMHAALMALAAGHYVIHLSYERKGFAAFADLGLREYVHNVRSFDPHTIMAQLTELRFDSEVRERYDSAVARTSTVRKDFATQLLADLSERVGRTA